MQTTNNLPFARQPMGDPDTTIGLDCAVGPPCNGEPEIATSPFLQYASAGRPVAERT